LWDDHQTKLVSLVVITFGDIYQFLFLHNIWGILRNFLSLSEPRHKCSALILFIVILVIFFLIVVVDNLSLLLLILAAKLRRLFILYLSPTLYKTFFVNGKLNFLIFIFVLIFVRFITIVLESHLQGALLIQLDSLSALRDSHHSVGAFISKLLDDNNLVPICFFIFSITPFATVAVSFSPRIGILYIIRSDLL